VMGFRRYRKRVNHPHLHALAIGHYASKHIRLFNDRIWRWGYFVEMNTQPPALVQDRPLRLLWVGRMLSWKRVDLLLRAVARLRSFDRFGGCTIVGDGPEKNRLKRLVERLGLGPDQIKFLPPVPFDEVRRLMRHSDVYVLPSDRREGWGAVAGEAFSEGCVLVANEQAGAARELIDHGYTGYLFKNGNVTQLASILDRLAGNFQERMEVRMNAWQRGNELWHPQVAAKRLVALYRGLLGVETLPEYLSGPCARLTWPTL
ncbi:MAG: glycosyltransferase family 4 protein, partial [Desulfatitalea sp.]|nr:glycosyltransferase family 4 protein [Desulfatitalea sp.]NNJ99369.1 glycosyltransferase family 4 protein [Desulfatitalea sp.]